MHSKDFARLLLLSALWGASYLFMRLGVGEFGALPLAGMRAGIAAVVLVGWLAWREGVGQLAANLGVLAVIGLTQSALPFVLFSVAANRLDAGFSAILGATTPLFTVVIARGWTGERLTPVRMLGLAVGFLGVVLLVGQETHAGGPAAVPWTAPAIGAMVACLSAAMSYGFAANYARRRAASVSPLTVATGSQLAAVVLLGPSTWWAWPATMPGLPAWLAVAGLGVGCTALAYVLFFRSLARIGPARTVTVTFLVPVFGVLWGWIWLDEPMGFGLIFGGVVVLLGTGLTTGLLRLPRILRLWPVSSSVSSHG